MYYKDKINQRKGSITYLGVRPEIQDPNRMIKFSDPR
jgi:hypothetical protein